MRQGTSVTERYRIEALIGQLQADLPGDIYAAAWERGKVRDLDTTVRELLATL